MNAGRTSASEARARWLPVARDSLLLIVVSGLCGLLFMLVHVVLGRRLDAIDYAALVSLIGLMNVLAVPSGAVQVAMARYVAEYAEGHGLEAWATLVRRAVRRLLLASAVGLAAWVGASVWLRPVLRAPSIASLAILGLVAALSLFQPALSGVLQGARRFGWMAASSLGSAAGRLAFAVAVAWAGGGVTWALGAFAASAALAVALASWPIRRVIAGVPSLPGFDTRPVYRYLLYVLGGQLALFGLMNADLILAKRVLTEADLAVYGKAAMLARLVVFLPQPLMLAVFPRAVVSSTRALLALPLLAALAITAGAAGAVSLWPALFLRLMYGVAGPAYDSLLRAYVWALVPLSLLGILAPYCWARRRMRLVLVLAPVCAGYAAWIGLAASRPADLVAAMAAASGLGLLLLAGAWAAVPAAAQDLARPMNAPSNDPPRPVRRLLVLSLAGAGDTLMATPLLRELRAQFPEARIDVLVLQTPAAADVLAGNPNIDRVLPHNFMKEPWGRSVARLWRLRRERYDLSISTFPQNRLAYNLVARLAGARERIGFDYAVDCGARSRLLQTRTIPERTDLHVAENNLRVVPEALGRPLRSPPGRLEMFFDPEHPAFAERFLRERDLDRRRRIGFHPGSGTTKNLVLKRWPAEKWGALARLWLEAEADDAVLLFGGPEERELRASIRRAAGGDFGGRLVEAAAPDLRHASALVARLDVMAVNDSLLTHVASALGVPVVNVMGPTPAASLYPWAVAHRIVRLDLPCSPCYGYSRHGIRCTNPRHLECLRSLEPERARDAIRALLAGRAATRPAGPPV